MLAKDYISSDFPFLSPTDNVSKALDQMDIYRTDRLAVVHNNTFLGFVREENLLDELDITAKITQYQHSFQIIFCKASDHILDAAKKLQEWDSALIAVIDEEGQFIGCLEMNQIFKFIAGMPSLVNPGSFVVIEMNSIDYSMGEISRLIESNDVKIIGAFITKIIDTHQIELTIKLNKTEISGVLKTLERFKYNVTATFNEENIDDSLQKRYDELMHYLKI